MFFEIIKDYSFCEYWGVTTTIFSPSDSIINFLKSPLNYCLIVISDKKTPEKQFRKIKNQKFLFVDILIQKKLEKNSLVKLLPWNSFGRKNLGYMIAIAAKAKAIYDFDDDNNIFSDEKFQNILEKKNIKELFFKCNGSTTLNSLQFFLKNATGFHWPRGYPLSKIKHNKYNCFKTDNIDLDKIYMWQSLADNDPDVDAIYRLTKPLNIFFEKDKALVLDQKQYTPTNAQSSIFYKEFFFTMFLPFSVPGRVSDIWRGYISQTFLKLLNGNILISSPFVIQYRNAHNYMGDFISEQNLYVQTEDFLKLLMTFSDKLTSIFDLKEIYINLYERGFIEIIDLEAIIEWLRFFKDLNI